VFEPAATTPADPEERSKMIMVFGDGALRTCPCPAHLSIAFFLLVQTTVGFRSGPNG
jgi:hypothetical protein